MSDNADRAQSRLWVLFVTGALLGAAWERALLPLYIHDHSIPGWAHVALNATGDGLLVLVLYLAGWLVLRNDLWHVQPGLRGYAILLGGGAIAGVIVETIGARSLEQWRYTPAMPVVPLLRIGLLPVVGALIIPRIAFAITSFLVDRRAGASS